MIKKRTPNQKISDPNTTAKPFIRRGPLNTIILTHEAHFYHIDIKIWAVMAGIVIVSAAGIFTTTMTIFRAAKVDPVKSLREGE